MLNLPGQAAVEAQQKSEHEHFAGQRLLRFALLASPAGLTELKGSVGGPHPSLDWRMVLIGLNLLLGVSNLPSMLHSPCRLSVAR